MNVIKQTVYNFLTAQHIHLQKHLIFCVFQLAVECDEAICPSTLETNATFSSKEAVISSLKANWLRKKVNEAFF